LKATFLKAQGASASGLIPQAKLVLANVIRARIEGFVRNGFAAKLSTSYQRFHMYAVIKTGGKQYKVAAGEKLKIEQIAADVGQEIVIDQILAVGSGTDLMVGAPLVAGATVKATVVAHGRHDKVRIFKMRRRKHYQKRQGHRQNYTELLIGEIASGK
jgi:large subunit ribosomal protein L21